MLLQLLLLTIGFGCLVLGAEILVRGSSRLASAWGVSPLVIGLTVVAFGTSSPEAAVSVWASIGGQSGIAMGNVIGSNIFNILVVLGMSAVVCPLVVAQQVVRLDVPLMIGASILLYILVLDGALGRWDGALLFTILVLYTVWAIRKSRRETKEVEAAYRKEFEPPPSAEGASRPVVNVLLVAAGLGLLLAGSHLLVQSAVFIARVVGVSELVIGLTIVAAGTSLPELATSVIAAFRKERDIAVGNVIGSNLFNILGVLGMSALAASTPLSVAEASLKLDLPVMILAAVACLPVFFTGHRINRWEGFFFLIYYGVYILYLILVIRDRGGLLTLEWVVGVFVLPVTAVTLAVSVYRQVRGR